MKMPWEDDINWGNTATTIVKGEPMSILIKGLDMPKEATSVTIEWWDKNDMQVRIDEFGDHETSDRVIQIPTPHGRLIDGDMVADMLDSMMAHGTLNRAYDEVMDAPTILEAEE